MHYATMHAATFDACVRTVTNNNCSDNEKHMEGIYVNRKIFLFVITAAVLLNFRYFSISNGVAKPLVA